MKINYLILVIYVLTFCSCAQRRNLAYFSQWESQKINENLQDRSVKIQSNDLLRININSLNEESNSLFTINQQYERLRTNEEPTGYRVSKEGMVTIPVVGNIMVQGMTIEEVKHALTNELNKYVKDPIVDVKLLNFKVTVIGEVNSPSSFTIPGDHINLLEALGMAGDMTVYGKRENVLIIREVNGKRVMKRLDLNRQDILNDEFFNLKQNDIVYVEPDKSKAIEYSSNTRVMPVVIASISAVAVLISAILRR